MSSPSAEAAVPTPEAKEEDSIVADIGGPDATDEPAPAASPEAGLTKKEFDMMTGILHRISNYRDEEYVTYQASICDIIKLTKYTVAAIFLKTFSELSTGVCFPTTSTS